MRTTVLYTTSIFMALSVLFSGCLYEAGCTDPAADNYDPFADVSNGNCIYSGCMDPLAINFDPRANVSNGTCVYPATGSVTIWSSVQCCAIAVYLEGQYVGQIDYFYTYEPDCVQATGTIKLNRESGTYSLHAEAVSGGNFVWDGLIQIEPNRCTNFELYL